MAKKGAHPSPALRQHRNGGAAIRLCQGLDTPEPVFEGLVDEGVTGYQKPLHELGGDRLLRETFALPIALDLSSQQHCDDLSSRLKTRQNANEESSKRPPGEVTGAECCIEIAPQTLLSPPESPCDASPVKLS